MAQCVQRLLRLGNLIGRSGFDPEFRQAWSKDRNRSIAVTQCANANTRKTSVPAVINQTKYRALIPAGFMAESDPSAHFADQQRLTHLPKKRPAIQTQRSAKDLLTQVKAASR